MGIGLMKCALVLCCAVSQRICVSPTPAGPNSLLTRAVNDMKRLCNYAIISFHVQDLILHFGHGPGHVANQWCSCKHFGNNITTLKCLKKI